jgi:hypothetical protein
MFNPCRLGVNRLFSVFVLNRGRCFRLCTWLASDCRSNDRTALKSIPVLIPRNYEQMCVCSTMPFKRE